MQYTHTETDHDKENEYPKLVRDRIPELIKANNQIDPKTKKIEDDEEYLHFLHAKLLEEADELIKAQTKENQIEEVADVLEILDAYLNFLGTSRGEIQPIQEEKRAKRGAFKERIILLEKPE